MLENGTMHHEAESQKNRLSEDDQYYLRAAGEQILQKFLADFPGELPDAIIYPDLGARPLFYLVSPVLKAVSKARGVSMPQNHFFKIYSTHPNFQYMNHLETSLQLPFKEIMRRRNVRLEANRDAHNQTRNPYKKVVLHQRIKTQEKVVSTDSGVQKFADFAQTMSQARAVDILYRLRRSGIKSPKLVIFDDFVSNSWRATREINQVFRRPVPTYAFLTTPQVVEGGGENPLIHFGMVTPYEDTEGQMYFSFDYLQDRRAIGYSKEHNLFTITSAPNKGSDRDPKAMRQLRQEMTQIGRGLSTVF